jgi:hypothetical protein
MHKGSRRFVFLALALLALISILLSELAAKIPPPLVAVLLLAGAWSLGATLLSPSESVRNCALLCSSLFFGLAITEFCLFYVSKSEIIVTKTTPEVWRQPATDVGSLPIPNMATRFEEFLDGREIADVTYRIDTKGLREITAAEQGGPHKVVFFGDSFMFGHGVENDQTLPYYFVQDAHGTFEGFNFAGEGWGPHQMLREIETGFVRRVAGKPDLAIYEAIPDHLRRVAGRAPWEDGPHYELCRGDDACYSGPFHGSWYTAFRRSVDKSWTAKFVETHFTKLSQPSDIPIFLAVLKKTRSLLEGNGTRFVIVLWDQNELARTMMKVLRENQFEVIALSSILPDRDLTKYPIIQLDRHPSPAANKAIAAYLWRQIEVPSVAPAH